MNLFRSLPKSVPAVSDPDEEPEPYMDPQWPHLVIVYEFLLLLVCIRRGCGYLIYCCQHRLCVHVLKGLAPPLACHSSGEIAFAGSRRMRSTLAAAVPVVFAHAVHTVANTVYRYSLSLVPPGT
jgi:hypothetical protein